MRYLILLLLLTASSAEGYEWNSFTEADGLPGQRIFDLIEAPDGAIWAAGENGVSRFDGSGWTHLVTGRVSQLAFDGEDTVWANRENALPLWFALDGKPLTTPSIWEQRYGDDQFAHVRIASRGSGELWVYWERTRGSDGAIQRDLQIWRQGPVVEDFFLFAPTVDEVTALVSDSRGECWIGTTESVLRTDSANGNLLTVYREPGGVRALLPLDAERAVASFAITNEVRIVSNGAAVDVPAPPGGFLAEQRDAAFDARGNLWLVGQRALRYTLAELPANWTVEVIDASDGLIAFSNAVLPRSAQNAEELWFGTEEGVLIRRSQNWELFDTSNGLLAGPGVVLCSSDGPTCNEVTEIAVDSGHTVWVGGKAGLSRRTADGNWTAWGANLFVGIQNPLHAPNVRSLELDSEGTLWVATDSGNWDTTDGGVQFKRPADAHDVWHSLGSVPEGELWAVRDIASDGANALWMAARDGIWRHEFSPTDTVSTHFGAADGAFDRPAAAVAVDADWVFAAADSNLLARYDRVGGNWTAWDLRDAFPVPAVQTEAMLLSQGVLYLGSDQGLMRLAAGATDLAMAQVLDVDDGFALDIADLAPDRDGFLLVATDLGLYRLASDLSRWSRLDENRGLVDKNISALGREGEFVWAGTGSHGAMRHRFEPPRTRIIASPEPVLTNRETLYVDVEGIDPDGPESEVIFDWRIDGGPWSAPWLERRIQFVPGLLGLEDGIHLLELRATDVDFLREAVFPSILFELDSEAPVPLIASPRPADAVSGIIQILGTVDDIRFDAARLRAWPSAAGEAAAVELFDWSTNPIVDDLLSTWDTQSVADDLWTLELAVRDQLGVIGTTLVEVLVDNEFPFAEQTSPVQVQAALGASVYAADGSARVDLPPFALQRDGELRVERVANDEAEGSRSVLISAEQARFDRTATLFIARASSGKAPAQIARRDGASWIPLGGSESGGLLAVGIDRPGEYAVRPAETLSSSGSLISFLNTEPRHLRPRSGMGGDQMNISFRLGRAADVHAIIYSRSGRPRRVLLDGRAFGAGDQTVSWDGRDADGDIVAAGLYIVCIEVDGERVTRTVQVGRD